MSDGTDSDIDVGGSPDANVAGRDIHGIAPKLHKEMLEKALADLRGDLEAKHAESSRADTAERETLALQIEVLNGRIGEFERRLTNPEAAYAEYKARIAELETLLQDATVEIGENRIKAAQAAMELGDYAEADAIFDEVLEHEARAVQRASEAAYGKGLIAEEGVRWADAARHFAHAARLQPKFDAVYKARAYAWQSGDYPIALRFGEDLVALTSRGDDQVQHSTALNEHALTLNAMGRYGEAEPLYRQALEIGEKTLGPLHPVYAQSLNNLAELLRETGRYDEAEPLYRQALEIREKALGPLHPDYAQSLNNLALLFYNTERYAEAVDYAERALVIFEASLGANHPSTKTVRDNLAVFRAKLP